MGAIPWRNETEARHRRGRSYARYKPSFHLVPDRRGLTLQARGSKIEFDSKTLGWIWLLGFAAWRVFRLHGPHLFCAGLVELPSTGACGRRTMATLMRRLRLRASPV